MIKTITLFFLTLLTFTANAAEFSPHSVVHLRQYPELFLGQPSEEECGRGLQNNVREIKKTIELIRSRRATGSAKDLDFNFINSIRSKLDYQFIEPGKIAPKSCALFLKKYYTALALDLTFSDDLIGFKEENSFYLGVRKIHQDKTKTADLEFATENDLIYVLAMNILKSKKIQFLDLNLRKKLTQDNEDVIWTEKSNQDRYRILGGYRCSDKAVYVDAALPPIDLGATFIHEMEHLFRDAFLNFYLEQKIEKLDEYIRNDELIASVVSGFSEWNTLRMAKARLKNRWLQAAGVYSPVYFNPYTISSYFPKWDVTFISPKGVLGKLFHSGVEGHLTWHLRQFFLSKEQTDSGTDLLKESAGTWAFSGSHKFTAPITVSKAVAKVTQRIETAYGLFNVQSFDPANLDLSFSPLMTSVRVLEGQLFHVALRDDLRITPQNVPAQPKRFIEILDSLNTFLGSDQQSSLCSQELAILKKEPIRYGKDGSKLRSRLGKDGTKLSSPIRPCLHGTNPL